MKMISLGQVKDYGLQFDSEKYQVYNNRNRFWFLWLQNILIQFWFIGRWIWRCQSDQISAFFVLFKLRRFSYAN